VPLPPPVLAGSGSSGWKFLSAALCSTPVSTCNMVTGMDNGKIKCHHGLMQEKMKKFAILLNGDLEVTARLKDQLVGAEIIAADGGMRHANRLGVEPICWIGDFDSSNEDLLKEWPDVPRIEHPPLKDKTDGELAVDHAIENGASEIVLVAGLGGQTDQVMSHLLQLIKLARQKIKSFASSGKEEAWPLLVGSCLYDFPHGAVLSIVGLSPIERLSVRGVKWELEAADVEFGSTLTMSNEVTGPVSIVLCGGCGVVLARNTA